MATVYEQPLASGGEEKFYFRMACLMAVVIVAGFAMNLAMGRSTFAVPIVYHIHAFVFFGWVVIYLAQNWLVSAGNVALHRRLGWIATGWVPLMLVMAFAIMFASLRRTGGPFFFDQNEFMFANTLGLISFVCGVVLMIWSFTDGQAALWSLGMPITVVGQAGLILGLVALGFTSIYREGFETVLFLQALVLESGPGVVLGGVAVGLACTLAVGFLVFVLQARLPHKKMLIVTGVMIGAVLLQMAGKTVNVMQVLGWLPLHPIRWLPLPYFPSPASVLRNLVLDWELLLDSTWHSLLLLLSGYALGAILGTFNQDPSLTQRFAEPPSSSRTIASASPLRTSIGDGLPASEPENATRARRGLAPVS